MTVAAKPIVTVADPQHDIPDVPIYRLSVAQYHAMAEAGIVTEDDRVELLQGWLVAKMSKNPPHVLASTLIRQALEALLPSGWYVAAQDPITLSDSVPEPDLFVVRGKPQNYRHRHPGPEDVALVIEVADTTLRTDRGAKQHAYAFAGIPIYWIANLVDVQFEVYTDPAGPVEEPVYGQVQVYRPEDTFPVVLDGGEIGRLEVRELLP